ncbi:hypothetical protein NC652_013522 [Populus alba x Populus x berolinensis]|nr:hypothetical protein NC652_013522 [Populus alba x Populus x berolinensis]
MEACVDISTDIFLYGSLDLIRSHCNSTGHRGHLLDAAERKPHLQQSSAVSVRTWRVLCYQNMKTGEISMQIVNKNGK